MKIQIWLAILACSLFMACNNDSDSISTGDVGGPQLSTTGSISRFTVTPTHLYTIDQDFLTTFDITNPSAPIERGKVLVGRELETVFVKNDVLFIGTTTGVYFFDIRNPDEPKEFSFFTHVRSCDPVTAAGKYAYATLRSDNACRAGNNVLLVINYEDPAAPFQVREIGMENPKGLAVRGDTLLICDQGLKLFDISDRSNPTFIRKFDVACTDVINYPNHILLRTSVALNQYRFENDSLIQISNYGFEI